MRLALSLVLAFLCCASIVRGQASACGTNCTGFAYGDDLFVGPGYGTYGLAYVHDASQPIIRALHDSSITTAAIIIHGLQRDAEDYYCYFKYALNEAGKADSTFFIAPRFMLAADTPATNQFFWVSNTAWMTGGKSDMSTSRIASFQILDDLLKAFDNKTYFPGLQQILVVGHSAGAQMAHRYAVATGVDSSISVPIRYVVENSGSYTYLDTKRAILPNITVPDCYACNATQILVDTYTFQTVDRNGQQACPTYNDWKMGLDNANVYVNKRNSTTIRTEYAKKNVTYLLGTDDTCNDALGPDCGCDDSSLDTGCDAEMQGFCRLHRGVIYYQYLQATYGQQTHALKYVEGLAHDGCGMITSLPSLQSIFPGYVAPSTTDASSTSGTTDASSTSGTTDASSTSGTTDASSTSGTSDASSTGSTSSQATTGTSTTTYTVTITFSGSCSDVSNDTINAIITAIDSALGVTVTYDGCTSSGSKRAASASIALTVVVPSTSTATADSIKTTVTNAAGTAGLSGASVTVTETSPSTTTSSSGSIATLSIVVFVLSLLYLC